MNPEFETLRAKLRKIQALAERGAPGEKAQAQRMLDKLLAANGLTLEQLQDETKLWFWFPVQTAAEFPLLTQCYRWLYDVAGPISYKENKVTKERALELTLLQNAELQLCYSHYLQILRATQKELRAALKHAARSVVQKYELFNTAGMQGGGKSASQAELAAMLAAMRSMPDDAAWERTKGEIDGPKMLSL